jgi:AraC-like DNA-binding protein
MIGAQTIRRNKAIPGVELRSALSDGRIAPHFHDGYAIALLTRGRQVMRTGSAEAFVDTGFVQLHAPFVAHSNFPVDDNGFGFAQLELSSTALEALDDGRRRFPARNLVIDRALFNMMWASFGAFTDGDALAFDFKMATVLAFLTAGDVADANPAHAIGAEHLGPVRDFLHAHFDRTIRATELCALSGLSRGYLSRAFAGRFGVPPHEYVLQLRVARVKRMLIDGAPLADAAVRAGFSDQSQMTRHFVRITRMTPKQYARG